MKSAPNVFRSRGLALGGFLILLAPLSVAAASSAAPAFSAGVHVDPYDILDQLLDRQKLPRLLSTTDVRDVTGDPEALEPVQGDFNGDRKVDEAFTGVYILPGKTPPYFLAVVGDVAGKPKLLSLEPSDKPIFLHAPGTTGPTDPGDQAFSTTECVNCSTGTDWRWDARSKSFKKTPWKESEHRMFAKVETPAPEVDPATVDNALRVAGALPDVQKFVKDVKDRKGQLGSRVEPIAGAAAGVVRVLIFEKTEKGEKLYDAIEVDSGSGKVVRRRRK